jgi:hypothetical protein
MAGKASFPGDSPFQFPWFLGMAPFTLHIKPTNVTMIKSKHPFLNQLVRNLVAKCAAAGIILFGTAFKMTKDAR